MTVIERTGSLLDVIRRTGVLDPLAMAALTASTAVWGPSLAAGYGAASLRYPNRTAIIDDHGPITYRQLEHRTNVVTRSLGGLGLARGDSIGILCRNHRGFVEANIAAAKLGARPVLLNTGLPMAQLDEVIERESISVVIADRDLSPGLGGHDVTVLTAAPEDDPEWSFPQLNRDHLLPPVPRPTQVISPVILTSGTTGAPKGARRSVGAKSAMAAIGFIEAVPYQRGDVMVVPAPLFHAWGFSQMVLSATLAGTVVLRRSFDPQQVLDDIEACGARVLAAVPVMLHRILDHVAAADPRSSDEADRDLSALEIVATSGSALPGVLALRWMDAFGDNLYNLYGSTEVGQVSVATPADLRFAPDTAGRPLRGIRLEVLGEDDQPLPAGSVGEILIASDAHFDGYTDGGGKRMVGELMSTGDRGYLDDDGRLFVAGRADDMIISGGENLFPANIERVLLSHEAVRAAAVVGVADDDLGQRVRAVVVSEQPGNSALTRSLKTHLRSELAGFEVPKQFVYVSELPRNATGKVLRGELTGPRNSVPNRIVASKGRTQSAKARP